MNTVEVETNAAKEEIENSKKIAIRFLNECDFPADTLAFIFMGFLDENPGTPCVAMVVDLLLSINGEDSYRFSDSRSLMSKLPRRVSASAGLPKGVQLGFCTFSKRSFTCLDTTVYSFRSHISPQT